MVSSEFNEPASSFRSTCYGNDCGARLRSELNGGNTNAAGSCLD
jgi:hypothetical protein